jgi:YVTN family beta-propeller protein
MGATWCRSTLARAGSSSGSNAPSALAVADGALWVASGLDATVQRVDLALGRPTRTVRLPANPTAMTAGAGALWVASEEAGTVTRIDPRWGTIISAIPVGNGPSAVAAGERAIWVVNRHDGTLSRIDPDTNRVSWTLPVGREPYCPYGAGSAAQPAWTAPDPERAQLLLMAASGRAGERVTVWMPKSREALGRYFAGLLDALGLRASLRVITDEHYFAAALNPRNRAQIGYANWAADYLTASMCIANFGCTRGVPGIALNASQYCDPMLDRLIDRALVAQGAEAARRWAAADRRIVDRAAAVPLTDRRTVVLVSKRVGNVQQHPQWLALLDQMWVR